jgi:hypothetical protein
LRAAFTGAPPRLSVLQIAVQDIGQLTDFLPGAVAAARLSVKFWGDSRRVGDILYRRNWSDRQF